MKSDRVNLEAAYVLHVRPYRETSQLLEVLTRHEGRLGLVARGARGPKARWRAVLEPFRPLYLSWSGRGTLCTLRSAEPAAAPASFTGTRLMSGYYLNELLLAFTTRGDPHPDLFAHYTAALTGLIEAENAEVPLRRFEVALLAEAGYGLDTQRDAVHGAPLDAAQLYSYQPERGAVAVTGDHRGFALSGASLQAIAAGDFRDPEDLRAAKRVLRQLVDHHLGDRQLQTRRVLAQMRR
ncbi:MAG: DNA repair protein RecO [Gammaproteobacteria bacterium]